MAHIEANEFKLTGLISRQTSLKERAHIEVNEFNRDHIEVNEFNELISRQTSLTNRAHIEANEFNKQGSYRGKRV